MEEIIDKFNLLVQEMADRVANVENIKEQSTIQEEYDKIIDEAEKVLEKELEQFIQSEKEDLEKEQKLAEVPLEGEDNNGDDTKDIEALYKKLKDKYTVKEMKALLKQSGIKGYSRLSEAELVALIIENELG